MASSLLQIRLDDELKSEANALFEALGIDLPTAIRMFLKRAVMIQGIPFPMTLPKDEYKAEDAIRAIQMANASAKKNGISDMTLDEINAEISAVRQSVKKADDAEL